MVPKICSVDGCTAQFDRLRRGMCRSHYDEWLSRTPISERTPLPPEARFWQRVDRRGPDECWTWQGPQESQGYGSFNLIPGQKDRTHRVALQLKLGRPIASGAYACHTCDNRMCCNPAHLYEGTPQSNIADAVRRERNNRGSDRPQSKLTDDDILQIRERAANGEIRLRLSEEFGVVPSVISQIAHGHIWKHLGGPRSIKNIHPKRKKAA